jgi:hypothetical protein
MKQIARYLHDYFQEQRSRTLFVAVSALLAVSFIVNYGFLSETTMLKRFAHPAEQFVFYCLFFGIPYCITLALQAQANDSWHLLKESRFLLLTTFAIAIVAAYIMLHNTPMYLYTTFPSLFDWVPKAYHLYIVRYASNIAPGLALVPLLWYWYTRDREGSRLYGFSSSNINLKTYFTIIALLAPLILAASYTADFQSAYPRYKFGLPQTDAARQWMLIGGFELCYGVDFIFVEFLFRGFMVMAMGRYLKTDAILPMVVVYAFIHFQKPIGEALSSILGGLVLGVISYRTKSIYGGIILHLGVAYLMEIAGGMQRSVR